jgi:hypothetical protein
MGFTSFTVTSAAVILLCGCFQKTAEEQYSQDIIRIEPGSTYAVTADMNDTDDPLRLKGVEINIGNEGSSTPGDLQYTISSSNDAVVPESNLKLTGTGNTRNLKIAAAIPGYTVITVTVSNGKTIRTYKINYAASQTPNLQSRRWHSGSPDASAAIGMDRNQMIIANDETNEFYIYDRDLSGPPFATFDFNPGNILALEDSSSGVWKEVDVEAGVRSIVDPSITYWIGSMSNNSAFLYKPNRNRLFAVSVTGTGEKAMIANQGSYGQLRQALVKWGDGHGYDFGTCAAIGQDSKSVNGFNIEGIVFGPDDKTLFIGFRAPLVPMKKRTKAVIAPILDFETWFNRGNPASGPQIGKPIELDLGGRGIRDIIRMPGGQYVIAAGSSGWELSPALFTWSGKDGEAPKRVTSFEFSGLNVEAVLPWAGKNQTGLQIFTDNGSEFFYCDTLCVKDLLEERFKKFSSVVIPLK